MSQEMMTTKEVAEYLGLNDKKIYALIKEQKIPCTRVTGKWIFPKALIDRWIIGDVLGENPRQPTRHVAVAGSHDLSLELFAAEFNRQFPQFILLSANLGSLGGLVALREGLCHMAGIHLLDAETGAYNLPFLPQYLPGMETVIVTLAHREQGLMVQPDNPQNIQGLGDLCRSGTRFVNRQPGSGTRVLLDYHLNRMHLNPSHIEGYDHQAYSHTEVAAHIRSGRAQAGLGILAAARAFGLDFIPIAKERFDLVIPKPVFYTEPIQRLLDVIRSRESAKKIEELGGYETQQTGQVLTWH